MNAAEDQRVSRLLRLIRQRSGHTQEALARLAAIPLDDVRDIEAGRVGRVRVDRVRQAFAALDGRLYLNPWWKGANADRLIDEEHAQVVEVSASVFVRGLWRTVPEYTFAEYGERGSVDLLAGCERELSVAICEIKSEFGSLEEMNRSLDVKVRLARIICERAFGWQPRHVGRLLIVPDRVTLRRVVQRHAQTMNSIYPERGRAIRRWIRQPDRSLSGIWFLSIPADRTAGPG